MDEAREILRKSVALNANFVDTAVTETCGTGGAQRLRVVCVSSSRRSELERLALSVEKIGSRLDVLGLGEPWRGLGSKIALLGGYLGNATSDVRDDDLVLFVDAYDVLLLPTAAELKERWASFERMQPGKIVFNSEVNCAPDNALRTAFGVQTSLISSL